MILEPPVQVLTQTPVLDVQVLLVEDEEIARVMLSKLLDRRGIAIVQAGTPDEALTQALRACANVILMDIKMRGASEDGVDIAHQILLARPDSSVIFVSAFSEHDGYRQRARDYGLRVAGWFGKPIRDHLDQVVELINREMQKVKLRLSLRKAMEKRSSLPDRLREFAAENPLCSPEVVSDILEELDSHNKLDTDSSIQLLYVALEHFADRSGQDPTLRKRADPLLARLEALERREADEFEKAFLARFRVKPGEISDLYEWARGLLEK